MGRNDGEGRSKGLFRVAANMQRGSTLEASQRREYWTHDGPEERTSCHHLDEGVEKGGNNHREQVPAAARHFGSAVGC
jgi:hypothetical protein